MARPEAGTPPVETSALARRDEKATGPNEKYAQLVRAFDRDDRKTDLVAMFGSEDAVQRFLAVAFHAVATNSDLLKKATVPSLIQAIKDSATLGLEPTGLTGEGWILVYGDQATFQPGWRGYIKRIRNSGKVTDIDCQVVYMNDEFNIEYGTDPKIYHVPKLIGERDAEGNLAEERGDYRGAYMVAWMPSGRPVIEYMTVGEIHAEARAFSKAFQSGKKSPWDTHPGEMYRKTVIKRGSKRLPQSAVDLLLLIDNRAEQIAAEAAAAESTVTVDVSAARARALAAVGARTEQLGPGPQPEATEDVPEGQATEPQAAAEPEAAAAEPFEEPEDDDLI